MKVKPLRGLFGDSAMRRDMRRAVNSIRRDPVTTKSQLTVAD